MGKPLDNDFWKLISFYDPSYAVIVENRITEPIFIKEVPVTHDKPTGGYPEQYTRSAHDQAGARQYPAPQPNSHYNIPGAIELVGIELMSLERAIEFLEERVRPMLTANDADSPAPSHYAAQDGSSYIVSVLLEFANRIAAATGRLGLMAGRADW